jgi:hypothetical protein
MTDDIKKRKKRSWEVEKNNFSHKEKEKKILRAACGGCDFERKKKK